MDKVSYINAVGVKSKLCKNPRGSIPTAIHISQQREQFAKCSVDTMSGHLDVLCKTGPHFLTKAARQHLAIKVESSSTKKIEPLSKQLNSRKMTVVCHTKDHLIKTRKKQEVERLQFEAY